MSATFDYYYSLAVLDNGYALSGTVDGQTATLDLVGSIIIYDDDDALIGLGDEFNSSVGLGSYIGVATAAGAPGLVIEMGGSYYFVTNENLAPLVNGNGLQMGLSTPDPDIPTLLCFMAGTMIATPDGAQPIETLRPGGRILAADLSTLTVSWIGRQTVSRTFADPLRVLPIRICAGALGNNIPISDLLLSPDHAIYLDGILVQAAALVNGSSIVREKAVPQTYCYYHVETARHALLLAEGVPAETFVDNVDRRCFDNWDERRQASAAAVRIIEMDIPRAKSARQVPPPLRARLEKIAGSMATEAA